MKKILFLLLCTVSMYGQTYPTNPTPFGKISINTNIEDNTASKITVQSSDNRINWLQPINIPIPISPANYTPTAPTLGGHLTGIDAKLGTIGTTTAGISTRVWFTADQTTITAGTFDLTNPLNKGAVASHQQTVANDDGQKKYFTTDLIGNPFAMITTFPQGTYAGNLSVSTTPTNANQKFTVELYRCNNAGTPIASGVTGAVVGSLGVTVIMIMDSGEVTLANASVTNLPVSTILGVGGFTINAGERIRYHVSAEKVGTAGAVINESVYYGSSYNSFIDVPVVYNSSSIKDVSTVTNGTGTVTDALNSLKASIPVTYSKIVYVNATNPNSATIFDLNNPPVTNDNLLKSDVANLYVGTDATGWVYNTTSLNYVTKTGSSSGTGTTNSLVKWVTPTIQGSSNISDNGVNIGITLPILTSPVTGSVVIRRGSSSDANNIFVLQNGAGTNIFTAKGNANFTTIGNLIEPAVFEVVNQYDPEASTLSRGIWSSEYTDSGHSPHFTGRKARGTLASPTTILEGDYIAGFTAEAYNGSVFKRVGNMAFIATAISSGNIESQCVLSSNNSLGVELPVFSVNTVSAVLSTSVTGIPSPPLGTAKLTVISNASNDQTAAFVDSNRGSSGGAGMVGYSDGGTATLSGDRLGYLLFGGATNNAHAVGRPAGIASFATQNWSASLLGCDLRFYSTSNGSASRTERARFFDDGSFRIQNGGTFTNTGEKLQVEGTSLLNGKLTMGGVIKLKAYTVSTLPTGTVGDTAYCTDLLTPVYMSTAVGGGAVTWKVFFDGTSWKVD